MSVGGGGKRSRLVLLVDDDPRVLTGLRRAFRHQPRGIVEAGGAAERTGPRT